MDHNGLLTAFSRSYHDAHTRESLVATLADVDALLAMADRSHVEQEALLAVVERVREQLRTTIGNPRAVAAWYKAARAAAGAPVSRFNGDDDAN